MDITQEMIDKSAQEEGAILAQSPAVLLAQNETLHQRVVLLRALANEQGEEIERLTEEIKRLKHRRRPADRKPPQKKATPPKS